MFSESKEIANFAVKKLQNTAMKLKVFILGLLAATGVLTSFAKKEGEGTLKLLYWNIQNGMWDGQTDDYRRFTDWVAQQQPDICVWCEAQKLYVTNSDKSERETEEECLARWSRLAERYGHSYVYLSAHPDNYPQLITSRFPMEAEKLITGNADTVVCHGASWYKVKMGRKKQVLNLVTLHTWPMGHGFRVPADRQKESREKGEGDIFRRKEMELICRSTVLSHPKAKKELWAMMGDFNSISRIDNAKYQLPENSTKFLVHDYIRSETPYIDLINSFYPQQFIGSTGSNSRIDFIYVTPALRKMVRKAAILKDSYTTPVRNPQKISNFWHPSDHLPIVMEFGN